MTTNKHKPANLRMTHRTHNQLSPRLKTQKELHDNSYEAVLMAINGRLDTRMAFLQRCLHTRVSDKLSNFLMQTFGRPSGVLGGGIIAGLGSMTLWYLASRYGFYYPSLSFIVFYAVGFVFGLATELSIKLVRRYRKSI